MKYLFFILLFAASSIFAQSDQKSDGILKKLSSEMKQLKSFYIDFSIEVDNPSTGEKSNNKGLGYVKGDRYYASIGGTTLISNGLKSWTVVVDEKVTYQSDVDDNDEDALTPKKLMTIWEKDFKSRYTKETTFNGKKMHQIDLFPTNPKDVNYHTIVLYIDVATNQLTRGIMKTKDGATMTYTIHKFEKNNVVEDSKFVYNPKNYPGYQLIRD